MIKIKKLIIGENEIVPIYIKTVEVK